MNIENERKLFEGKFFNSDFLFSDAWCDEDHEYYDMYTQKMWEAWQASVNREGFVLVPREATSEMLYHGYAAADNLAEKYKAMVEASQENKDE